MITIETFKPGHYESWYGYKYFVPEKINDEWIWSSPEISQLLERAAVKLGMLNSFAQLVPNLDLFIELHVTKEAVLSSRIEGTQTKMDEALLPLEEVNPERRNDWQEVNNYIKALNEAIVDLEKLPISTRLIRKTHKLLLHKVRGEHKMPGDFRTSQNWIGGNTLSDAKFIPPRDMYVGDLMGDLECFLNNEEIKTPALIRIAIAHYQFETIHPFLDGNGRIGRLLITLFLVKENILNKPLLYLSTFFERRKDIYYDNLNNIRVKNDMLQWIKYFLVGIEQTATIAVDTLSQIIQFKDKMEEDIRERYGRRSTTAIVLMHKLLENPYTNVEEAAKTCNVTYKSANSLIKDLCADNYLKELTGQSRNRIFVFQKYMDIFEKDYYA